MNKGYTKAVVGALWGFLITGGWLAIDLLTPEPYGDFALFGGMAIVNIIIGWRMGIMSARLERAKSSALVTDVAEDVGVGTQG